METDEATGGFERRRSRDSQGADPLEREAQSTADWSLDDIMNGDFPWLDEASVASTQGSAGLRLKRKLESLEEDKRRGKEECALVKLEMERTLERYRQQIESLGDRILALEAEKKRSDNPSKGNYILGSIAIVALRKVRLVALLKRAQSLFSESSSGSVTAEELGAAAVENALRSTTTTRGSQADSELDSDVEWEGEEMNDDF